jgi:hypothetical protein
MLGDSLGWSRAVFFAARGCALVVALASSGCTSDPGVRDSEPYDKFCERGATLCISRSELGICSADREGLDLERVCDPGWICLEKAGAADCVQAHCGMAGKKRCFDNVTASCNAEHTYDAEQDCGDQLCVGGECLALSCSSSEETLCLDDGWYDCDGRGAKPEMRTGCGTGARCSGLEGLDCVTDPCPASQPGCIDNQVGVCSEDGVSLSLVSTDCAERGQICARNHDCVDSTVDTLGPSETESFPDKGDSISLSVVRVDSSRLLTKIEAHLTLEDATDVAWLIYEREADGFALRLEDDVELGPGSDVFSSSPLSFELESGRSYAIGFYLSDGSGCFNDDAPDDQLSFGRAIGSRFSGGGDYHQLQHIPAYGFHSQLDLRLSTSAIPAK